MRADSKVPADPFRAILNRRIYELQNVNVQDPVKTTAHEAGLSEKTVQRIRGDQELIEFDTADRIVTRMEGPMAWHEKEVLRRVYVSVNLRKVDEKYPIKKKRGVLASV